jgi:pimeloyl-ACP methyl ester carboxylesterase
MLNFKTYEITDALPWVVFVHGAGGSSSIWYKQIKDFSAKFNVLLVDLRDHGNSKKEGNETKHYTFKEITKEVIEVMDFKGIEKAHFIGISLGSIIIRELAEINPNRVKTMILGGAVTHINLKGRFLMNFGNWFKRYLPYMLLYKIFAFVIMPKKSHKQSRLLFIEQAKKLAQKEFIRWYKLTASLTSLLKLHRDNPLNTPTLYLMGSEDHMFLDPVKQIVKKHSNAYLEILQDCGHVVNVDQPKKFNELSIQYIQHYESQFSK